jgi:hypothetical protein
MASVPGHSCAVCNIPRRVAQGRAAYLNKKIPWGPAQRGAVGRSDADRLEYFRNRGGSQVSSKVSSKFCSKSRTVCGTVSGMSGAATSRKASYVGPAVVSLVCLPGSVVMSVLKGVNGAVEELEMSDVATRLDRIGSIPSNPTIRAYTLHSLR